MNIGIIGAGYIGSVLAEKLVALGHTVSLANSRGPETLGDVAKKTGARAVKVEDVVKGADLVVVTIPQKNVPALPPNLLRDLPPSVIVIDTGNYYPSFRDGPIEGIEAGETESGWVAKVVGRPVLKVFNSIMWQSLVAGGKPKGTAGRLALPVAGDDAHAKAVTMDLVEALGFDAVDAGSLAESWRQEPGTPVYCTDLELPLAKKALSMADRSKSHEARERSMAKLGQLPKDATQAQIITMLRTECGAPAA